MRTFTIFIVPVALCLIATAALAEVPYLINFQGTLANAMGEPINSELPMQFILYSSPDTEIPNWSEFHPLVAVYNGLFQVELGTIVPFPDSLFNIQAYGWRSSWTAKF